MTLDQLYNTPIAMRRRWTRHQAGLNHDGQSVCMTCGIGLPRLMPTFRTVCTYGDRLYLDDIPDATPCTAPKETTWRT